ncbi:cache domain-containing protein [Trichothermofontia sp.]
MISRITKHLPLRVVFTVPVLLQLVGVVGLVGYLSFRNGQRAVQNLASQLRGELSARIERELKGYFSAPHDINRLNATALVYGELDVIKARAGENFLFQQMKIHPTIAFVYCGSANQGEFFGVLRSPDTGELQLSYSNASNQFFREYYSLDARGSRLYRLYQADRRYDSRTRPWFQAAIGKERPVWTNVYIAFTTGLPNVTASLPVYDRTGRRLLGVCATDVVLPEEFRNFLKGLRIGKSGQAFVLDRQGHLISSSTDESLAIGAGDDVKFLKAIDSQHPLIQSTARYLLEQFGSFEAIQAPQQLDFWLDRQHQFLEVLPFRDDFGLDWLIVVVVPESDFMATIASNTRMTILLCLIALGLSLLVGVILTRWVTSPILTLNAAVKEIAQGCWDKRVNCDDRTDEVGELAKSVNRMAMQLQTSFANLEAQKNSFSRFFPTEYLKFLSKQDVTEVQLGDHVSKDMAILFSDIRSFTSLSEKMTPQETFDFINDYLQRVSPQIRAHNGVIIKFLGDGVMAVFPDRVADALNAALAQIQALVPYNQQRQLFGKSPIHIGLGIHIGHMMVGIVGEENRIQGDALSDNVNLTARLEGLTKYYGVPLLVSEDVLKKLPDAHPYQVRFLDRAIVKGRTEPIAVYEIVNAETDRIQVLKLETLVNFEQGISLYQSGQFSEATQCFQKVLAVNTHDQTAQLYLERIQYLTTHGIPKNWNGTWSFTQK